MGKRIIQQRRGSGGPTYRSKSKNRKYHIGYLAKLEGEYECVKLIASAGHTIPIAKFMNKSGETFLNFACDLMYIGKIITIGGNNPGDITRIGDLKNGTEVFNIEHNPKDGGKFIRTGGNAAEVMAHEGEMVKVWMPSKKTKKFNGNSRVTVGVAAGDGRIDKPVLKAGNKFYIMKNKSKLWPKVSAVKMNAIDHPFGSGRGKRMKSAIAKRNASPGKKVGLIRPSRTGRKKR